jgi:hypothetical protein
MRPPSPRPSEAGPTDSPTQTRGVGRTPGASARPGHGSAGGQVGEKIEKEDECCSLPLRCRAGARIQMARTLPATGLLATCHLALLAALWCHRAPAASLASHKTGADSTRPPVPPSGGTRRSDPSRCGRPRPGRDDAVCGDRAIVGADLVVDSVEVVRGRIVEDAECRCTVFGGLRVQAFASNLSNARLANRMRGASRRRGRGRPELGGASSRTRVHRCR